MTPERQIRDAVEAAGLRLDGIEMSKHVKVWVSLGEGKGLWVLSKTASDHRTWRNALGDLRRLARRLKQGCSGPALSLVVPRFGTCFVALQTNNAEQEGPRQRENRCLAPPLCLGPSIPKTSGQS